MNQQQLSDRLKETLNGFAYTGSLSPYAVQSIELARSNYPVQNLITYCQDMELSLVMTDMATEDRFCPNSVLDVHKVLDLLMQRYKVDYKLVYRKTGIHYTPPKSLVSEELEQIKKNGGGRYTTPLSIKTLLAVCEVIYCDLTFEQK